jgi:transposase
MDNNNTNIVTVLGVDLSKTSFQIHGINKNGKCLIKKSLTRKKFQESMVNMPPCLIGMEACGSANYWARELESFGHTVKLMSPQYVKPYVKTNKNDAADAEAICEAVQRPNMRFVSPKSIEQQDIQSLHRMRSLAVSTRTAVINQIRGLLQEYGITIPISPRNVTKQLPLILEDAENGLSMFFRTLLSKLYEELRHFNERKEYYDEQVNLIAQKNEDAKRLQTIPGIGPITATALVASIGNIQTFKSGRQLAAWLGLVPRQHSTGGRHKLLGISKRGDKYLRSLLVHGARAVKAQVDSKNDKISLWLKDVMSRRHKNVATVALANKMARMVFAILKNKEEFQYQSA